MKNKLFSLLIMTIVALGAVAQQKDPKGLPPEARATKQAEMLQKRLKLTDDQVKRVTDINLRYAQKLEELRQEMKKASEYRYKKDQEMEKVLTPAQFREYLFMKDKIRGRHQEMRKQNADKPRKDKPARAEN